MKAYYGLAYRAHESAIEDVLRRQLSEDKSMNGEEQPFNALDIDDDLGSVLGQTHLSVPAEVLVVTKTL